MNDSTNRATLRVVLTVLCRVLLSVTVLTLLCVAGATMICHAVLTGPSESARNMLTMVLLDSPTTRQIPASFLSEDLIAYIHGNNDTMGTSDASLAQVSASLSAESTVTHTLEYGTATVKFSPEWDASLRQKSGDHRLGRTAEGVMILLDDDETALTALSIEEVHPCGATLLLNGQVNEKLLSGNMGYAPYLAVGQRGDGMWLIVSADYANYRELINIMVEYGAVNACVLGVVPGGEV